jgi:hypothetical protein
MQNLRLEPVVYFSSFLSFNIYLPYHLTTTTTKEARDVDASRASGKSFFLFFETVLTFIYD